MKKPILYWLDLNKTPIFKQLQIEEGLIRTDTKNICLINFGSPRAIVMGISGETEKLIHKEAALRDQIPIIKRFSGGGTVIVDEDTLFISFLFQKETLPIQPFPESLLRWSTELYQKSWQIPEFALQEQDYTIGTYKCGGNAQYIRKERWLHHSSFLWDYKDANMNYLKIPPKRPQYRLDRSHSDFLCKLKDVAPSPQMLINQLKQELQTQFVLQELPYREEFFFPPHRQTTERIF